MSLLMFCLLHRVIPKALMPHKVLLLYLSISSTACVCVIVYMLSFILLVEYYQVSKQLVNKTLT